MPITGLVIVLSSASPARAHARAALVDYPGLTLGFADGARLPAVLESDSTRACNDHIAALSAIAGVAAVNPVFHDFSDEPAAGDDEVAS